MSKYILIISAVFPPEPVVSAKIAKDLYYGLKEKGHAVKVLHPMATRPLGFDFTGQVSGLPESDEITTDSYTCAESKVLGRAWESYSFGKACSKYIRQHHEEIKCVYLCMWALFGQYLAVKTCQRHHIPYVVPVQDMYPETYANKMPMVLGSIIKMIFIPMDKYVLQHAYRIHVISNKMKDYLSQTRCITEDKFTVVLNWQDESEFVEYRQSHGGAEDSIRPFTFMYMGNIGPIAGVDLLIDAFVKTGLKNARLVIAGSGSMKSSLQEQAAPYNNIEFWDVPNGKVPEIQAQADCMLLPMKKGSAGSSIPSKLPAYMFSAKPVIGCVDAGSDTAEAIREAECGWVIEPENAALLAERMKEAYATEKTKLKVKSDKSLHYGLTHFSKSENLCKLIGAFDGILNNS